MKFFSTIKKYNPVQLLKNVSVLQKQVETYKRASRPYTSDRTRGMNVVPYYPYPLYSLYEMAYYSDVLTGMHRALRTEIFRNGFEVIEAEDTNADITDSEEEESILNPEDRKRILSMTEKVNKNNQSLLEVFYELEDDYNIADDCYLFMRFDYEIGSDGKIKKKSFVEALRVHPQGMSPVINFQDEFGTDDNGDTIMVGLSDRSKVFKNQTVHPKTGEVLYPAWFVQMGGPDGQDYYFFEWEIIHDMRYRPSKRLGFSPVLSTWQKVRTLFKQDEYILELYEGKRPPKGMLLFNTNDQEALKKAWDGMVQRAKESPHLPGIMGVPSGQGTGGGKFAEWLDFMKGLEELQFTAQREEFRKAIGFVYGVSPVLMNDTSSSGGLNNEGMQYTVTNRTVEAIQERYNAKFLRKILEALGIEGWVLKLRPSEEQDEMARLQRLQLSLTIGEQAARLGLEVEYDDRTAEAVISAGTITPPVNSFGEEGSEDSFGSFRGQDEETIDEPTGSPSLDVGKFSFSKDVIEKAKGRKNTTNLGVLLKEELDKFLKKFKRKPTEKEFKARLSKINRNLKRQLSSDTEQFIKAEYSKGMRSVGRELNMTIAFGKADQEAINVLANQKVLSEAFDNLSDTVSGKISDIIERAYKKGGMSLSQIKKEIQEVSDVADYHAENIARTESSKVSSAARRNSYEKADPDNTFKYVWIGPADRRTTVTSKSIKRRAEKGVSYDDLVKIVTEESAKEFPTWTVNKDALVSHWQSRHTFLRKVR